MSMTAQVARSSGRGLLTAYYNGALEMDSGEMKTNGPGDAAEVSLWSLGYRPQHVGEGVAVSGTSADAQFSFQILENNMEYTSQCLHFGTFGPYL